MENRKADSPFMPLWLALLPLLFLMGLLVGAVQLFGDDATSGPTQISLLLAAVVVSVIGVYKGYSWSHLEGAMIKSISMALKPCMILLTIGALIGSWMLAGTTPTLIYVGLGLLSPDWFYPAALIISAIVAVSTGSSWTTAGTIGLALVGIAQVLGLSMAVTAGAVISGAYFGDKMSPLSDSTNLAPAMVGADLFVHIRHMFWTTFPAFVISFFLFIYIGWDSDVSGLSTQEIQNTRTTLENNFDLGWHTLIPLFLLLGLAIKKVAALPTISVGVLSGCAIALVYQPEVVRHFVAMDVPVSDFALNHFLMSSKGIFMAMADGYSASTGNERLDKLLSQGGMSSMLNTVWLIISAMCFSGVMESTKSLSRISDAVLSKVKGTGSLVASTVFTAIGFNIVAADQYIAIVMPGRMYKLEFERRGLAPENLSRTLEDAGTMTSALVPWNTCGAFMAGTLGVATLAYLPFAFLNLLSPVIAIFYGIFNVRMTPLVDAQPLAGNEKTR